MDQSRKLQFLYSRAGFGITPAAFMNPISMTEAYENLFPKSPASEIIVVDDQEWADNKPAVMKNMQADEKKEMKKEFNKRTEDLNLQWLQTMMKTAYPLQEKIALFWHGHFATHIENPYYDQQLLNIFRNKGLGNFGDLLHAVSKSPAMLQYLNNQQNKKSHPNENFAREVMELFTLGRGNYTEDDIKESARAFTGWGVDENGNFKSREKQHDFDQKTFLGKTGNFDGDDILNIILDNRHTAEFISRKVYKYFVSDEEADEIRVKEMAKLFYDSHLNITVLLKSVFESEWFYQDKLVGEKVKSPIELLIGYQKAVAMRFDDPKMLIKIQKILGQYLFNPPNVAGWAGGRNWIDSSSLMVRMRLPEALYGSDDLNLTPKEPGNDNSQTGGREEMIEAEQKRQSKFKLGKVQPEWSAYLDFWKQTPQDKLPRALANYLLNVPVSDKLLNDIVASADKTTNETYLKTLTMRLMELPEYQLI